MKTEWKEIKWPYNDEAPYCNWVCYKLGKYIIYPSQFKGYTFAYVMKDDHSGLIPKHITSLDSAKIFIEEKKAKR